MQEAFSNSTNIERLSTSLNTEVNPGITPNSLDTNLVRRRIASSNSAPIVGQETLLYDGSSDGVITNSPWFEYQDSTTFLGGTATPSMTNNVTQLVTDNQAYAGFINYEIGGSLTSPQFLPKNNFPTLDPNSGFIVSFTAELVSETARANADKNSDGTDDRAGFSVIVLGNDRKGVELGFWAGQDGQLGRIFEQRDGNAEPPNGTLFTQGGSANYNTKQSVNYDLAIIGNSYELYANGSEILSGSVKDYSAFEVPPYQVGPISVTPPDPYELSNFLFFGDNTPTSGATVKIERVAVTNNATIPDQTINSGQSTAALPFNLLDIDADSVTITGSSSDTNLIPNGNIVVNSMGKERTVTVTPAANQTGTAEITLTFSDNNNDPVERKFNVTVNSNKNTKNDFNGDNKADMAWFNSNTGEVAIWTLNDFAIEQSRVLDTKVPGGDWKLVTTGDFNGDDKDDMLWRNMATGENAVWLRDGFGDLDPSNPGNSKQLISSAGLDWEIIGTGDLDGNKTDDIIWRNKMTGENVAWLMDGFTVNAQYFDSQYRTVSTDWEMVGIGYFDDDNKADIMWRNKVNGDNAIWLMDGLGAKTNGARLIAGVSDMNWQVVGVGDSDNDGTYGIMWQNQSTGETAIWSVDTTQLDGDKFKIAGEFITNQSNTKLQVSSDWMLESFTDYNGDGKADALWRNKATGETALWWLDGAKATRTELITSNNSPIKVDANWQVSV